MIAATHLDNWLFFLLVAIAMLFRWLTSVAKKASKGSDDAETGSTSTPPAARPARTSSVDSDTERVRKFLEALGQPPGSSPPTPVAPRPSYQKPIVLPRVGPFGSPLPPLTTRPPDLPTQPEPVARPLRRTKSITPKVSETAFEVREVAMASAPKIKPPAEAYAIASEATTAAAPGEINIATLLRSRSGLRNAIILREVFGPPRSLSESDWHLV
jgi:hypothetical protein